LYRSRFHDIVEASVYKILEIVHIDFVYC